MTQDAPPRDSTRARLRGHVYRQLRTMFALRIGRGEGNGLNGAPPSLPPLCVGVPLALDFPIPTITTNDNY